MTWIPTEEEVREVELRELSRDDLQQLGPHYPEVNVGDVGVSANLNSIVAAIRESPQQRVFLLKWKGNSRVPAGVEVAGHIIRWTQHGFVRTLTDDKANDTAGTYDRLVDCGGADGEEHEMLIYISSVPL